MRVLLVDADSHNGFPNLALMKLSAYHKQQGDTIVFIKGIPTTAPLEHCDKVYISCVFFQNADAVRDYAAQFTCPVELGGSGLDLHLDLPHEIEHIMPDYSLYDVDFSLGFTSRGCIRNCGFCVVPEKEGMIKDNAPISEFHNPTHNKVVLLDNNFGASPRWKENLAYIQEHDLKVNFNQGLDIRILTKEFAEKLAEVKYYNWTFKKRSLHFAFDDLRYKDKFKEGIETLISSGIPASHIMVYVLVGYNSTIQDDLERISTITHYGAVPYVMRYNSTKNRELAKLARWVNRMYYQFIEWSVYK